MPTQPTTRPGRNDKCPCGSGKKYKHCCLDKDEAALREQRAQKAEAEEKAAAEAASAAPAEEAGSPGAHDAPRHGHEPRHATAQPWKGTKNSRTLPKFSTPRRSGNS